MRTSLSVYEVKLEKCDSRMMRVVEGSLAA
jgi:hypothetical protein